MKKMSDVFELPIKHARLPYLLYSTDYEEDVAIVNAINHVDALAEALEDCAELLLKISFESSDEYQSAMAALAAYRVEL